MRRALVLAAALAAASVPAVHAVERSESYFGRVKVDVVRGWGIVAGVDVSTPGEEPDGIYDQVILLEAYGRIPQELPLELDRAWVEVRENGARIGSATGDLVVLFSLLGTDDAQRDRREAEQAGRRRILTYAGFGLSSARGTWSEPLSAIWQEPSELVERRTCSSGGTGSTSCSVTCGNTGCSVSCSAGSYACCNCGSVFTLPSCSCEGGAAGGGGTGGGTGGGEECSGGTWCPPSCMRCGDISY